MRVLTIIPTYNELESLPITLGRLRAAVPVVVDGTLALAANRNDTYPLGALYVGGRKQPGDLVFNAYSSIATNGELLRAAIAGRPWPFSSPVTFWGLMLLFCLTVSRLVVLAAEVTGALSIRT